MVILQLRYWFIKIISHEGCEKSMIRFASTFYCQCDLSFGFSKFARHSINNPWYRNLGDFVVRVCKFASPKIWHSVSDWYYWYQMADHFCPSPFQRGKVWSARFEIFMHSWYQQDKLV